MMRSGYAWLNHEMSTRATLPLRRKLHTWRHDFYSESALLYDLPRNDPRNYLSDLTRTARCQAINSQNEFFRHKLVLRSFLIAMGFRQAKTVALVFEGRILGDPFGPDARHIEPEELVRQLSVSGRKYLVKPEDDAAGENLFLLQAREGQLVRRRGRETSPYDIGSLLRESEYGEGRGRATLIEEEMEQGSFWQRLFPESGNTMQLLTLWTPGEPSPFIARAVQRIGTSDTVPTDSWSAGGISVPVELSSGRLGQGRVHPLKGKAKIETAVTHHPQTGTEFTGTVVPGWDRVQDTVIRAAASLPFNRMAGWDVLVSADGEPVILAANGDCEINLLQVHGGLLADPRVRRFYEAVGAIHPS
jgi:hypothetical protein